MGAGDTATVHGCGTSRRRHVMPRGPGEPVGAIVKTLEPHGLQSMAALETPGCPAFFRRQVRAAPA